MTPERPIFFVDDNALSDRCISVNEYTRRASEGGSESILGSGRCEIRRKMMEQIIPPFATIICPISTVLGAVGQGAVIAPGAVVAPNVVLAPHVLINYNATVGHDSIIGSLSVVGPGAAVGGWCHVADAVYIGAGALIREKLHLNESAIIGMGAVVTRDMPLNTIAVGVPAHFISKTESGGEWLK